MTPEQLSKEAARAVQDKALRDAAMQALRERYKDLSGKNLNAPEVIGSRDGEHGPSALRRIRADAVAALNILLNVHGEATQNTLDTNDAPACLAWSRDFIYLSQAIELVEKVELQ